MSSFLFFFLLLLLNVFDNAPVFGRVTNESWTWAVTWSVSEMRVSKDEYAVTVCLNHPKLSATLTSPVPLIANGTSA